MLFMKRKKLLFALIMALGVAALVTANFYLQISKAREENGQEKLENNNFNSSIEPEGNNIEDIEVVPQTNENSNTNSKINTENNAQNTKPIISSQIVSPLDNSANRVWLNTFGNVPSKMTLPKDTDYSDLVCKQGKGYAGYHTGADFEVIKDEQDKAVSMKAIADGVIRSVGRVNGYGGLIVEEIQYKGATYTVYYGHVDLDTAKVKTGDKVKTGQKIVDLGPACSAKNGDTRKHLHLGIHKGSSIVVTGYITDKKQLANWINPMELISSKQIS